MADDRQLAEESCEIAFKRALADVGQSSDNPQRMQPAAETGLIGGPLPKTPALLGIARRLIWWMTPEEALEYPARVLAQVMTLGTWNDVQQVRRELGEAGLMAVLQDPPAGVFDQRSWHYWHHVFGIRPVPELPLRKIP